VPPGVLLGWMKLDVVARGFFEEYGESGVGARTLGPASSVDSKEEGEGP
jgi:hypothetical protein